MKKLMYIISVIVSVAVLWELATWNKAKHRIPIRTTDSPYR